MKKEESKTGFHHSGNIYTEYPARKELAGIADFFWSFNLKPVGKKRVNINFVPTHQTSVIVVLKRKKIVSSFLHGPSLKKKTIRTNEPVNIFAVSLTPFAALRYFRLNFNSLLNKPLSLKKAAGGNEFKLFTDEIEICKTDKEIINVFTGFLLQRKKNSDPIDEEIAQLCSLIINSHGEKKLDEYYNLFSSAKRQIQRKFKKIMSFTPKEFSRLVRIQQAGSELVKSGFKHFDVLFKYGYYDQSHYIKEFQSIMGSSPKDFEFSQKKIEYKFIEE